MMLVTTKMNARPTKQNELAQTLCALAVRVQKETGGVSSRFYRDVENDKALCVLEEWATRADMDAHLRSENFRVLCGAVKLLNGPAEMEMRAYSVSHILGMEASRGHVKAGQAYATPARGKENRMRPLDVLYVKKAPGQSPPAQVHGSEGGYSLFLRTSCSMKNPGLR